MLRSNSLRSPRIMRTSRLALGLAVSVSLVAPLVAARHGNGGSPRTAPGHIALTPPRRPVTFEENRGQTDSRVKFLSHAPGYSVFLTSDGAVLRLERSGRQAPALRLRFVGSSGLASLEGQHPQPAATYYAGPKNTALIKTTHFEEVRAQGVYPDIDAIFRGADGQVRFDFELAANADPSIIGLQIEGTDALQVGANGDLELTVGGETVTLRKPFVYQDVAGTREPVEAAYRLDRDGTVRFQLGAHDPSYPLVIDPTIEYATYLGSEGSDRLVAVDTNSSGELYVFGVTTDRATFPTTHAPGRDGTAAEQCVLSKFDPTGSTLLFSVVYQDTAQLFTEPARCDAMSVGYYGQIQTVFLSVDGTAVKTLRTIFDNGAAGVTATTRLLIGTEGALPAPAVKMDSFSNIYILGTCFNTRIQSPDPYPYPGGFRTTPGPGLCDSVDEFFTTGPSENVLLKYNSAGQLIYGTFVAGGLDRDTAARALAITDDGIAYVGGRTHSPSGLSTPDGYQPACALDPNTGDCDDGYILKINTNLTGTASLAYGTYLGGSGQDSVNGLAVAYSKVTAVGESNSPDIPGLLPGGATSEIFAIRLDLSRSQSAQLDGTASIATNRPVDDARPHVAMLRDTSMAVTGVTEDPNFIVTDPLYEYASGPGTPAPFLTILSPDDLAVRSSVLLPPSTTGSPAVTTLGFDTVFLGLTTNVAGLGTPQAFQDQPRFSEDEWVVRIGSVGAPNRPPVLNPMFSAPVQAASPAGATVIMAGFARDPDFDPLTGEFSGAFGTVPANMSVQPDGSWFANAALPLPIGTTHVTLTVSDDRGGSDAKSVDVTVLGSAIGGAGTFTLTPQPLLDRSYSFNDPRFTPKASITLEHVTGQGVVTLDVRTDVVPPLPNGYQLGSPPYYYQFTSTAPAQGPYTICIDIAGMSFADPGHLHVFGHDGSSWIDGTIAPQGSAVCGTFATVGTYAVLHPVAASDAAVTIAGSSHTPNSIDGPGGDPLDDLVNGGSSTGTALGLGVGGLGYDRARGLLYTTGYALIRRVNLNTGIVDTIGGDGTLGDFSYDTDGSYGILSVNDVPATESHITNPRQLALDGNGDLYIAEYCQIRKIERATGIIRLVAGDGFCRTSGDGGQALQASFYGTVGLAFDSAGSLFVGQFDGRVRRIDPDGTVSAVVGDGSSTLLPAIAVAAGQFANRMAFAPNGDLYLVGNGAIGADFLLRVAAGADGLIRGAADEHVTVVNACQPTASCPATPFGGDGGPVSAATFRRPSAVSVEPNGNVLVYDNDLRIREISAGADGVVTGTSADEIITTLVGHDSQGANGPGYSVYYHAEDRGHSSFVFNSFDVVADPAGGLFYLEGGRDIVRHVTGTPVAQSADADLAVSVTTSSNTVKVGQTIHYEVFVNNNGPGTAHDVGLSVPVTAGTTVVSATSPFRFCVSPILGAAGTIACEGGTLAPGAVEVFTIELAPGPEGLFTTTFTASTTDHDPVSRNDSATATVTVNALAPLVVNAGPDKDVPATSAAGAVVPLLGSGSDPEGGTVTLTWSENGVPLGTGAAIAPTFAVGEHIVTLTATSGTRSSSDTATITVSPSADLYMIAAVAPTVLVGDSFTYDVRVFNAGPFGATTARLRLEAANVQVVSATIVGGQCEILPGVVVCDVDNLASGASAEALISARPLALGQLTGRLEVSSPTPDPNSGNNVVVLTTTCDFTILETVTVNDALAAPDVLVDEHVTIVDTLQAAPEIAINEGIQINESLSTDADIAVTEGVQIEDTLSGSFGGQFGTIVDRTDREYYAFNHQGQQTEVSATFAEILTPGFFAADPMPAPPTPPPGWIYFSTVYEVTSTVATSQPAQLCFHGTNYQPSDALMHFVNGAWSDITLRALTTATRVCGSTSSFSPFAVLRVANQPPAVSVNAVPPAEATSAAGATLTITGSASDPDQGDTLTLEWREGAASLGTGTSLTRQFPLGSHTLTLTATDNHGASGSASVTVVVQDTSAPVVTVPAAITVNATSSSGAVVTFTSSALDTVDGALGATCVPASGSKFAVGTTTVTCSATDAHHNTGSASFTVTVRAVDQQPPVVTAPPTLGVPATNANGARASEWPQLAAWLSAATARDAVDPSPTALPPLLGSTVIAPTTLFPIGTSTVTFRFRDASGNVGSATSKVTVSLGTPKIAIRIAASGSLGGTRRYVDLAFTNSGTGIARHAVTLVVPLTVKGKGIASLVSPGLPIGLGDLVPGASNTIRVVLDVPASVKGLTINEAGTYVNVKNVPALFVGSQSYTP